LFFNDFILLQLLLISSISYLPLIVSPWTLWILGGVILFLLGLLGLILQLSVFIGFLWVIDLGVGLIFLVFLSHLAVMGETKLPNASKKSRKFTVFPAPIILILSFLFQGQEEWDGHYYHAATNYISWVNYYTLYLDYEVSQLGLLREVFFYSNSWEFIVINYIVFIGLLGLVLFNFTLTNYHKRQLSSLLRINKKTKISSAPLFIRDQNFISQQQTSSATRLWVKTSSAKIK